MEEERGKDADQVKERKNHKTKFQKLWNEEDEITLLNGYYEYRDKKGKYDGSGFFEFIKHRLNRSGVNQHQISDKICRLKKKYTDTASKLGSKVEEEKFQVSDSHLQKLFELSRKNWGIDHKEDASNVTDQKASPPTPLSWSPSPAGGARYELSDAFIMEDFFHFLLEGGVDIDLLDEQTVINLKRKFGGVELARSKFEYKQAKLESKVEKLKYDYYKRVCGYYLFNDS